MHLAPANVAGGPRRGLRVVLAGALAAVLLSLPFAPAAAQTVEDVRVVGNEKAEDSLVFQSFGVEKGDTYQIDRIRQGIRNLYRQGLFRDVQVEADPGTEGVVLTIRVQENPSLLRVRYDGAKKLKQDDFDEVVQLVPGEVVSARDVDQARRDILDLYEEKGYLLAEVEADLKGDRRADLVFHVNEGKKVQVKRIRFSGNEHVSGDALRKVMETKEDRWYRGADFKRDVFEEDKRAIVSRLGEGGYVDARVVDVTKTFNDTQEELDLDIAVEEGPQYRVGSIDLDHGGVIPEERLRRAVVIREGEPFNTVLFEESTQNLYTLLHEDGYIYCSVDAVREPADGNVIDVDYHVLEREPARINRIVITGNTKTKEQVIRRELHAQPGDVFRRSNVLRSQREVFQLGFFNDIQLDSRTADRETGAIDLLLNVEERTTGTASLGAGVNSTSGLTGFLQLSQNNFLGRGQVISMRGEFGRFRELEFSFTEPWLFGTPTSAGFDLYDTRRRYTEFVEKRRGGGLRVGRPFPWLDYTRVTASYSLANYVIEAESGFVEQIGDIDPGTGLRSGRSEDLISSVALVLFRNSVDSPFFPTRGSATRVLNEFGGGFLQGDQHFDMVTLQHTAYFRTVGKFVLSLGGQVGVLQGLDTADEVPFWKRFRLGGISRYGLRGYEDFDVVPDEDLASTGGRSMFITTTEIRYPLVQAVQTLAFFDAGNTWESPTRTDLADLKRGAGFGIRIDVPMVGQLGFDYGYGFDRSERQGGPGWQFHFQLGGVSF
jgi:outer membrane protein insertion porin family